MQGRSLWRLWILSVLLGSGSIVGCATGWNATRPPDDPQEQWGDGAAQPAPGFGNALSQEPQPSPSFPESHAASSGPQLVMPFTGGLPVMGMPLGGNVYEPLTGGLPVMGSSLTAP